MASGQSRSPSSGIRSEQVTEQWHQVRAVSSTTQHVLSPSPSACQPSGAAGGATSADLLRRQAVVGPLPVDAQLGPDVHGQRLVPVQQVVQAGPDRHRQRPVPAVSADLLQTVGQTHLAADTETNVLDRQLGRPTWRQPRELTCHTVWQTHLAAATGTNVSRATGHTR